MNKRNSIIYIGREHLHAHPDNPRKDLGALDELRESIRENGIMQNLTVIPQRGLVDSGEYTILIGHRRFAASEGILDELPCVVVDDLTDREQVGIMLCENLQRNDLTYYEQAQGKHIADMEQESAYRIDMMADDIFALDERLDEAELRLDDHMATMVKIKNEIDELKKPTPTPKAAQRTTSHKVSVRLSENDIQMIAKLVYEEAGVFSVDISSTRASAESIRAVRDVIKNGTTLPKNVLAFRNQHYHRNFGRPYCCIDGVYFSSMR